MDSRIAAVFEERELWLADIAGTHLKTRRQTIRDIEDAGNREDMTRRDYAGRYPLELLQNAHDASSDAGRGGRVAITVTRNALLVANEGRPFSKKRLESLVRQGSSEKATRRKRRTIGYKGVGFSSVFEITKTPQIITGQGYAFGFDRSRAIELVERHFKVRPRTAAARNFPFQLEDDDWSADGDVVVNLLNSGFVTVVRLPFNRRVTATAVMNHCWDLLAPQTLALMPYLSRLEYGDFQGDRRVFESRLGAKVKGGQVVHVDEEGGARRSWVMRRGEVAITRETIERLDDPSWEDVSGLRVTVGLPWKDRKVDPSSAPDQIYVYFQTGESTGRSCLIHGDFYVDSRRSTIMTEGAAGEINSAAASKAAELLAGMASDMALSQGGHPLAALAETGIPSTFGEVVNARLREALRQGRVLRSAAPSPKLARPSDLCRLDSGVPEGWQQGILRLVKRRSDLVRIEDISGECEQAAAVLDELEVPILPSAELANRVSVARSGLPYEKALAAIAAWLPKAPIEADEALQDRKILRTLDKRWCAPRDAVLLGDDLPALPSALGKHDLAPVRSEAALDLLDQLEIETLDRDGVFALLTKGLSDGSVAADARGREALHGWLWRVWLRSPSKLGETPILGGAAPVRVRDRKRGRPRWRPANETYYGAEWGRRGELLETLLGQDDKFEFLVSRPPSKVSMARTRRFYAWLGVREIPRRVPVSEYRDPHGRLDQWWQIPDVARAARCPDGHHSDQHLENYVWERLDTILEGARRSAKVAAALLELTSSVESPYGDPAEFRCTHQHHRGRARGREAIGYQRWRLRNTPWLLVVNDPGKRRRRSPAHVWGGLGRVPAASKLLVPRPAMHVPEPGLELIPWTNPRPESARAALNDVRRAFRDLSKAPEVAQASADRLLKKLETALSSSRGDEVTEAWLPAVRDGARTWAEHPVVLDIPSLEGIPELDTIDIPPTSSIRRALGLQLASQATAPRVLPGRERTADPILAEERRAQLLAILERRGRDTASVAPRLATLKELWVSRIDVELTVPNGERRILEDRPFFFDVPTGRLAAGSALYLTSAWTRHQSDVGSALAAHLGMPADLAELVTLVLAAPQAIEDIPRDELEEALDILHDRGLAEAAPSLLFEEGLEETTTDPDGPTAKVHETPSRPTLGRSASASDVSHTSPGDRRLEPTEVEPITVPRPAKVTFSAPEPISQGETIPDSWPNPGDDVDQALESDEPTHRSQSGSYPRDAENDERVERFAVEYVEEYGYRELGVEEIVDRQRDRCGWDLEFRYEGGRVELVEVKGSRSDASFEITRNELRKARQHPNWVLYFLANQASTPVLYRFGEFGRNATEPHLQARTWSVTGWRALAPERIEIRT